MRSVSGLFDNYDQVIAALDGLSEAGIASGDISVVGPERSGSGAAEGAGVGAAIGGLGGLLAGLSAATLPGIGPVVGLGWLLSAATGAAAGGVAGGLIGHLLEAGIARDDAEVYAEGVRRGSTLVVARVDDEEAGTVRAILARAGSVDTHTRRSEFRADGWDGFADKTLFDDDIGAEDRAPDRDRSVVTPVPGMR